MNAKFAIGLTTFVAALVGFCTVTAEAAPPWGQLLSFKRVEADPDASYTLSEENGPWLIMACSFSGDGSEEQARELAYELRKRYKLKAYTHRMHFDFDDADGRGVDQFGRPIPMRYRSGNERDEYAVLVGDFSSVSDPDAQRTLQKLKYSRPNCLEVDRSRPTTQNLAGWRVFARFVNEQSEKLGPMGKAFVTTNPLLPKEFFVPNGVDELVVKMNKGVTHSLLDCEGRYTVQVAQFTGNVILKQDEINAITSGSKRMKSSLMEAADKAHRMTERLREKGYDAYEFHDRYASIVTVGSFDSVGTPRADGKTEINPKVLAVMRKFGTDQFSNSGASQGTVQAKAIDGIPFDIQPIPVMVPKRSIGAELSRGPLDFLQR